MRTICLSSREGVHCGGCDQRCWSVVPSCIQWSHIRITVVWFRPTRLQSSLKDNPQSRSNKPPNLKGYDSGHDLRWAKKQPISPVQTLYLGR
ncbi:hypothetical protein TNCV_2731041 [Trichonephila clavipes]|nr:hypothetical protein TNCV_2731041 [Trichonephila clavipes]